MYKSVSRFSIILLSDQNWVPLAEIQRYNFRSKLLQSTIISQFSLDSHLEMHSGQPSQHPSSLSASTTFAQKAYLAKGKETDQVRKRKKNRREKFDQRSVTRIYIFTH